jgi:hypothetical protein
VLFIFTEISFSGSLIVQIAVKFTPDQYFPFAVKDPAPFGRQTPPDTGDFFPSGKDHFPVRTRQTASFDGTAQKSGSESRQQEEKSWVIHLLHSLFTCFF